MVGPGMTDRFNRLTAPTQKVRGHPGLYTTRSQLTFAPYKVQNRLPNRIWHGTPRDTGKGDPHPHPGYHGNTLRLDMEDQTGFCSHYGLAGLRTLVLVLNPTATCCHASLRWNLSN